MPLPANDTAWPPAPLEPIAPKLSEWAAWYEGDPHQLRSVYQRDIARVRTRPSQHAGGVVGAVARFWWGRPTDDLAAQRGQLHIPIAGDLCQASADLLFSEPPTLSLPKDASFNGSRDRLDVYANDLGMHTAFAEAAEVAAALGGVYLRATWDLEVEQAGPFTTAVHADAAWPEFRYGRLVAVTFWRVIDRNGSQVRRHLERHELDANGVGVIFHGIYEGTDDNLGTVVPLTENAGTRRLADQVDDQSMISTQSPGLGVTYVRNQGPQRRWRSDPVGSALGRSDLDGIEGPMDALDEAWSSWMRDLRLGKARVIAARSMLEDHGPGQGASFDMDREVFSPVNALASRESSGLPIEPVQFAIRVEEHARTCQELTEVILRSAGYSAQTFGEGVDGSAITASEVTSRERRSYMTRDRKIRQWKPALARHVEKLLAVDAVMFTRGLSVDRPDVAFADAVQADPEALARTAETLHRAQAASLKVRVQMAHPDWDDEQVMEEVGLIEDETAVPDPVMVLPQEAQPPPDPGQEPPTGPIPPVA